MVFSVMLQIVALGCISMVCSWWGRHSCLAQPKVEEFCGCAAKQIRMSAPSIGIQSPKSCLFIYQTYRPQVKTNFKHALTQRVAAGGVNVTRNFLDFDRRRTDESTSPALARTAENPRRASPNRAFVAKAERPAA